MGDHRYELVEGWTKLPDGWSFTDVGGLDIDSQDRVYVVNRGGAHPVMVFDRDGNLLASWGDGLFKQPHGICVSPSGFVYCTDDGSHTVSKFTADGKLLMTLGNKDQPSDTGYVKKQGVMSIKQAGPPFNRPTGVALSASGEIYVTDGYGNARVHKFSPDGTLLSSWGEPGAAPGQFRAPHGIWVDEKRGRLWIADRENSRIQIFTMQGEFLDQWTDVKRPQRAWIDKEDTVYVTEFGQRVSIFTIDGKLLARWGNEGSDKVTDLFSSPHAIAVDSHGDLYVGEVAMSRLGIDRGPRSLQKFARIT
jgi:DNA-binding beta-propeller fold protein YncE